MIALLAITWIEKLGLDNFTKEEILNPQVAAALIGAAAFSLLHVWRGSNRVVAAVAGALGFGTSVTLAFCWARPQVRSLDDFWCWIPLAVAGISALRIVEQFHGSTTIRWLLRFATVSLFATLVAPKGEGWGDWSTSYGWWIFGISQMTLVNWATLEFAGRRGEDRLHLWPMLLVMSVAPLIAGQTFASLKDICVLGASALGAVAVAQTMRPSEAFSSSVAAGFSMLLCATLASCDFYDNYGMPTSCFLLVMAAPVGLLLGEFTKKRWLRASLQFGGVLPPLFLAVWQLTAFVDSLESW